MKTPTRFAAQDIAAYKNLYHVTAHAVGREKLFRSSVDKREFLSRFRNYLDPAEIRNSAGRPYDKLNDQVSLVTFGLIDNHHHLILEEIQLGGMRNLMHRVQTSYGRYYNDRYGGRGRIFSQPFRPTPLVDSDHARRAIAYVHLNHPIEQLDYAFTGHGLFMGRERFAWVATGVGLAIYGGPDEYKAYLNREGPAIIDRKLQKAGLCRETYKYRPIP